MHIIKSQSSKIDAQADWKVKVTDKTARAVAGLYPLPAMGSEITVAIGKPQLGQVRNPTLHLGNYDGQFMLVCYQWDVEHWPAVFGVQIEYRKTKYEKEGERV